MGWATKETLLRRYEGVTEEVSAAESLIGFMPEIDSFEKLGICPLVNPKIHTHCIHLPFPRAPTAVQRTRPGPPPDGRVGKEWAWGRHGPVAAVHHPLLCVGSTGGL